MTNTTGLVAPRGTVSFQLRKRLRPIGWQWHLRNWLENRVREVPAMLGATIARGLGQAVMTSEIRALVTHKDGTQTDYGVVSRRVVTTVGVNFIVDAFQNSVELENMKYHGFGTGGAAEAVGNTALTTELTTEYAVNNTRPTGTTTEGASANIYRTVATLSPDANVAITEHGIFDQASNAGGVLLDRSLFSVINLVGSADSLQVTYELTFTAGS